MPARTAEEARLRAAQLREVSHVSLARNPCCEVITMHPTQSAPALACINMVHA